jgi:hypothetical protein
MKWAIKLPFDNDYLFVVKMVDGSDTSLPLLFNTHEEALDAAKPWKNYQIVEYKD